MQRTDFEVHGKGSLLIEDNLLTNYTAGHVKDGTKTWVSDGISVHHANATIRRNDIIDVTDVGIVLFGHDGTVQSGEAYDNTIVHAGNSAYGSLVFDTIYNCHDCRFKGSMHDNTIFAGEKVHSDIMLSVGTGSWIKSTCGPKPWNHCDGGATMTNNRTIVGDVRQVVRVQESLVIDGMKNALTTGNLLAAAPDKLGACFREPGTVNFVQACIGH